MMFQLTNRKTKPISLSMYKLTGTGYERGWWTNCHCRYRVFEGARNTKKSYVVLGLEILDKILSDPRRNVLVLRQTSTSNRDSTFNVIVRLINQPDLNNADITLRHLFKINQSDMRITRIDTGQTIRFGGMSDATRLTSSAVQHGFLTDVYVEEAFELKDYDAWRVVDGSIRGKLPKDMFLQITFLLNAWNVGHWIYDKFFKMQPRNDINGNQVMCGLEDDYNYLETHDYMDFKNEDVIIDYGKGLYLHKSTYKINEFRDKEIYDIAMLELKRNAPEIYKVEALGMWGNSTGGTYPEFTHELIKTKEFISRLNYSCFSIGIDTGYSDGQGKPNRDPNAQVKSAMTMQLVGLTQDYSTLACIDEYFYSNEQHSIKKTAPEFLGDMISQIIEWKRKYKDNVTLMKGTILVYVDCADKGFREGLQLEAERQGLYDAYFLPSTKIPIDTRVRFIRLIMGFKQFLISENCQNLIREIKASKMGEKGQSRADGNDHSINANEYARQPIIKKMKRWGEFKK